MVKIVKLRISSLNKLKIRKYITFFKVGALKAVITKSAVFAIKNELKKIV